MFALGCIQALQCNKNTCPTGITTHDKKLQRGLIWQDKALRIKQYVENLEKELEMVAHACGVENPRHLNRSHARIVLDTRNSIPLADLYPDVPVREERIKIVDT